MKKIVFFGDSNTYGYDPANWEDLRYPPDSRWTTLVGRTLKGRAECIEAGMNGRRLPDLRYDRGVVLRMIEAAGPDGILCTMLGTNDVPAAVSSGEPAADRKMDRYLSFLCGHMKKENILIIAPPHIGGPEIADEMLSRYYEESCRMNLAFKTLCAEYGVRFADAAKWGVEMCFDYIHFSEAGHRTFAERMTSLTGAILYSS